ncbi:MAG: hypothetical protein L0G25_09620 [Psychrobacter sp.]|nr:hypothetical protein [Psychrobacter sp.]
MTDRTQLFHSIRLTLISSAVMAALLGCQPATTEDSSSTNATEDVAADSASAHDMHDEHDEHADHDMAGDHEGHDHSEHDDHEGNDHSGHNHASKSEPFACEPEATIGVFYHNDDTPQTAHLLIDGLEYDLEATSDSKNDGTQVYSSDIGLDDTHGIIWQPSGDSAILSRKTLDSDVAPADEDVLYNCQKASE